MYVCELQNDCCGRRHVCLTCWMYASNNYDCSRNPFNTQPNRDRILMIVVCPACSSQLLSPSLGLITTYILFDLCDISPRPSSYLLWHLQSLQIHKSCLTYSSCSPCPKRPTSSSKPIPACQNCLLSRKIPAHSLPRRQTACDQDYGKQSASSNATSWLPFCTATPSLTLRKHT